MPNLMTCPDCGASISRRAATCIACGAPLREPPALLIPILAILGFVGTLIVAAWMVLDRLG